MPYLWHKTSFLGRSIVHSSLGKKVHKPESPALTASATSRIATAVAVVITPTSFHEKHVRHTSLRTKTSNNRIGENDTPCMVGTLLPPPSAHAIMFPWGFWTLSGQTQRSSRGVLAPPYASFLENDNTFRMRATTGRLTNTGMHLCTMTGYDASTSASCHWHHHRPAPFLSLENNPFGLINVHRNVCVDAHI